MIKDENELKEIVEQIKATLGIEQLDELEREYNKMYKEMKAREEFLRLRKEAKESEHSGSTTNES